MGVLIYGSSYISHFENSMSGRRQGIRGTDDEWMPVVPSGLMAAVAERVPGVLFIRPNGDDRFDLMAPDESTVQYHLARRENMTGNHGPRNHPIAVPTRAGEPVRG